MFAAVFGRRVAARAAAVVAAFAGVAVAADLGAITAAEFDASTDFLIVGGGTAAHFALRGIRERDTRSRVTMVSAEERHPYPRPPLSKDLWFEDRGKARRVFHYQSQLYQSGTQLIKGHSVKSLDVANKYAVLDDGRVIQFSKCLLATGGKPKSLADAGVSVASDVPSESIMTYRTYDDYTNLRAVAASNKSVTVLGGGLLGSELVAALSHESRTTGVKVGCVFPETGLLANYLPGYLSSYTTAKIREIGVAVHSGTFVKTIERASNGRLLCTLNNGSSFETDHIVCALGIRPNVEIASGAGLEIDESNGGVLVNAELEARRDIFAAGDICSYHDVVLGRRRVEHQDHAENSGLRAGGNMTGERVPYTYQSLCWSALGDIYYEACGIVDPSLELVSVWHTKKNNPAPKSTEAPAIIETDPYSRGVVYYMRGRKVVGVLLWNVRDHGDQAKRLLQSGREWDKEDLIKQIALA